MTDNFQLFIQTNSPGELSSWVLSICQTCAKFYPQTDITIFLTPCQYATGQEKTQAQSFPLVKKVYTPKETIKHLISLPLRYKKKQQGAILFLGGDPMYSQLLGLKHHYPIYGYHERTGSLGFLFKHSFTQHEVGNLMADKITQNPPQKNEILGRLKLEDKPYTLFFSSSRPKQFQALFPLLCETIQEIKKTNTDFYPIMNISPFIPEKLLNKVKAQTDTTGIQFFKEPSIEMMSIAKWLITIPGTSTAEAAFMELPMIVLIPLNHPELLIFDGLSGLISHLPLFGPIITQGILLALRKKVGTFSQPNRMLLKPVIPEIAEIIIPQKTAQTLQTYLKSEQLHSEFCEKLKTIPKPENVSLKICKKIFMQEKV